MNLGCVNFEKLYTRLMPSDYRSQRVTGNRPHTGGRKGDGGYLWILPFGSLIS